MQTTRPRYVMAEEQMLNNLESEIVQHPVQKSFVASVYFVVFVLLACVIIGAGAGVILALE